MKKQYRVMEHDGLYDIEERIGRGSWAPICEVDSLEKATSTIRALKALESEEEYD